MMSLLAQYKRIRISKSGKFCLWNQKSGMLFNCGIQCKEPGIQVPPTKNPDQLPGIRNPQRQNPRLSWFLLMGWHFTHDKYPCTRMELWRLQCWRQSLLKWTMKRKTYLCLFLLKHQWKQETFVFITFSSFRKVNFYSKICWFPVFIWFRSLPVAYTTKRKHWPRLINNFNRKMSMRLLYYPEIWRKTAKKFQNRWPEL